MVFYAILQNISFMPAIPWKETVHENLAKVPDFQHITAWPFLLGCCTELTRFVTVIINHHVFDLTCLNGLKALSRILSASSDVMDSPHSLVSLSLEISKPDVSFVLISIWGINPISARKSSGDSISVTISISKKKKWIECLHAIWSSRPLISLSFWLCDKTIRFIAVNYTGV